MLRTHGTNNARIRYFRGKKYFLFNNKRTFDDVKKLRVQLVYFMVNSK